MSGQHGTLRSNENSLGAVFSFFGYRDKLAIAAVAAMTLLPLFGGSTGILRG